MTSWQNDDYFSEKKEAEIKGKLKVLSINNK